MRAEDVHRTVAEVADQDVAGKVAARDGRHSPRSVQGAAGSELAQEDAFGIEDIDETEPRTRNVVLVPGVLLGVRDVQLAADILDVEGSKASRDRRIGKCTGSEGDGENAPLKTSTRPWPKLAANSSSVFPFPARATAL